MTYMFFGIILMAAGGLVLLAAMLVWFALLRGR